ncbi:hypothetical protein D7322_00005 [Sphingobacterium puteale]|uniref:Uncharacterized protein n=1 Tax=Sphingobacterium puteale TaxID=2420510 RepID=A0A420W3E8_9SPHI|nr:hypothetical protein [Sphingobacterium puteale]RKO73105.1 hypothetical protein D7322_00005 [Sphingobacterium puteale]
MSAASRHSPGIRKGQGSWRPGGNTLIRQRLQHGRCGWTTEKQTDIPFQTGLFVGSRREEQPENFNSIAYGKQ